ncbi:nucleotidyltransferase domain-containing protein [Patescibacteria group bacterium]|nr:nucleotidyltransferase domain-containing protein [Patescibacteria group bacterium]MBU2633393.1 nucleotidyltransferase domain-containing protein [Patescibacteria group bacterium]
MEKEAIINEVVGIVRRYLPEGYKIYLFGSWAKGNALKTSDLDVGILGETAVSDDIMTKISREVQTISTLRGIDVVDLREKSDNFRKGILKYARLIKG